MLSFVAGLTLAMGGSMGGTISSPSHYKLLGHFMHSHCKFSPNLLYDLAYGTSASKFKNVF